MTICKVDTFSHIDHSHYKQVLYNLVAKPTQQMLNHLATNQYLPNSLSQARNVWVIVTWHTWICYKSLYTHVSPPKACTCHCAQTQNSFAVVYYLDVSCTTHSCWSETIRWCVNESQMCLRCDASRANWLWASRPSPRLFYISIRDSPMKKLVQYYACLDCKE